MDVQCNLVKTTVVSIELKIGELGGWENGWDGGEGERENE